MASFDSINYSIRPNKNVERKLMIECLKALADPFNIPLYNYIGMGSFWFIDFILIHRDLSIQKMYSIELPPYRDRAEFNRPLNCIKVVAGESTLVLPDMKLDEERSIIWLDYDKGLDSPFIEDLQIIGSYAMAGTVVIVTINGHPNQILYQKDENNRPMSPEQVLYRRVGALAPQSIKSPEARNGLAKILGGVLFDHLQSVLRDSGRSKISFLCLIFVTVTEYQ